MNTPLTLAARRGALGVVQVLLAAGADVGKYDGDGDSALDIAADWVGVHLESALLDQIQHDGPDDRQYVSDQAVRPRRHRAGDGDGADRRRASAPSRPRRSAATPRSRPCWRRPRASRPGGAAGRAGAGAPRHATRTPRDLVDRRRQPRQARRRGRPTRRAVQAVRQRGRREREFGVDADRPSSASPRTARSLIASAPCRCCRRWPPRMATRRCCARVLSALGHQGDHRALPQVLDIIGSARPQADDGPMPSPWPTCVPNDPRREGWRC
ncbi:ankyrin repeat domain-containing protein [Nonomuraea dietziae]|uniref:ankyrin repeat domain-containing protein n=1 Tax=Nonomuraea dietziae TaxID=65515 RepID=UPI0031D3C925